MLIYTIKLSMSHHYDNEFLTEQCLEYQTLKALIQKKHQIRINFSNSSAFRMLHLKMKNHCNRQVLSFAHNDSLRSQKYTLDPKERIIGQYETIQRTKAIKDDDLFEVVERHKGRLGALGHSQEKPLMRNSTMSRTYRRKKTPQKRGSSNQLISTEKATLKNGSLPVRSTSIIDKQQDKRFQKVKLDENIANFLQIETLQVRRQHQYSGRHSFSPDHLLFKNRLKANKSKLLEAKKDLPFDKTKQKQDINNSQVRLYQTAIPQASHMRSCEKLKYSELIERQLFFTQRKPPYTSSRKRKSWVSISPKPGPKPTNYPKGCNQEHEHEEICRPWTGKYVEEKPDDNQQIRINPEI